MSIRFNWGTAVALVYVSFASATIGVVTFAMHRPVVLVTTEYYAEALRQDERNEAILNGRGLGDAVSIVQTDARLVNVSIPREQARTAQGLITLYRAADAAADRTFPLAPDPDGRQVMSLAALEPGHWMLQLRWTAGGRAFYLERALVLR